MKILGVDGSINGSGFCKLTLNDSFDITNVEFWGYSDVIKRSGKHENIEIRHVGTKYRKQSIMERQDIVYDYIDEFIGDVSNAAIEDYAFDAIRQNGGKKTSNSLVQLGEFNGGIKRHLHLNGINVVAYPPTVVKKFATGNGAAGKPRMVEMFHKVYSDYWYPMFDTMEAYESPQADLVDAFWIALTLKFHMQYEILGSDGIDSTTLNLLETSATAGTKAIVEYIAIKGKKK